MSSLPVSFWKSHAFVTGGPATFIPVQRIYCKCTALAINWNNEDVPNMLSMSKDALVHCLACVKWFEQPAVHVCLHCQCLSGNHMLLLLEALQRLSQFKGYIANVQLLQLTGTMKMYLQYAPYHGKSIFK